MMPSNAVMNHAGEAPPHPVSGYTGREDGRLQQRGTATLKRHVASIQAICDEVGRPFEEIAGVYQIELLRLAAGAVVVEYLPVLVGKHVRALYKRSMEAREPALL